MTMTIAIFKNARPAGRSLRGRSIISRGPEPAVVSDRPPAHPVEPRARRGRCRLAPGRIESSRRQCARLANRSSAHIERAARRSCTE